MILYVHPNKLTNQFWSILKKRIEEYTCPEPKSQYGRTPKKMIVPYDAYLVKLNGMTGLWVIHLIL